jgi:hypothetical protein
VVWEGRAGSPYPDCLQAKAALQVPQNKTDSLLDIHCILQYKYLDLEYLSEA